MDCRRADSGHHRGDRHSRLCGKPPPKQNLNKNDDSSTITGTRTSLLANATAVDRYALTFSWVNPGTSPQQAYRITVYSHADGERPVFRGEWVKSSRQTAVTVEGLREKTEDNQLYYWTVDVKYQDGSQESSSKTPFVTAVGRAWESTDLMWAGGHSGLFRASVRSGANVAKAVLTVTGLNTEAARRNVYDLYVNGEEIGVGPNRSSGGTVYYNAYDITKHLRRTSSNMIGAYAYSSSDGNAAGLLMQLTYFYDDGTSAVVYNSARDRYATQAMPMDDIVYRDPTQSIGTMYYAELAQNVDVTRWPTDWQEQGTLSSTTQTTTSWRQPTYATFPQDRTLRPAITGNTSRTIVDPASITHNTDGSWTVDFGREIEGDVQLSVTDAPATDITIDLGEELENGKARSALRTGNHYHEMWHMQGTMSWRGMSLKGFRYATITNYPGTLDARGLKGLQVVMDGGAGMSSFQSNVTALNTLWEFGRHTTDATTIDTIPDSVTRERGIYEGDALIIADLSYAMGDDPLPIRNTWNYLLDSPTQYTEYRLMTAIGVYEDWLHTGDDTYVHVVYERLKPLLDTVTYDEAIGLVRTTADTTDLVDWPRSETVGYDFDNTRYKTAVNAVAYRAYTSMAHLAEIVGSQTDAELYNNMAKSIKTTMLAKLYDSTTASFYDGLNANGGLVEHHIAQNDYYALWAGVYADDAQADSIAKAVTASGHQTEGSIYSAYFLYMGLYRTGNGQLAQRLLTDDSGDTRSYLTVIKELGATIAPEAWNPQLKPNMTFSHPWGAGGPAAMTQGTAGIVPTAAGWSKAEIRLQLGDGQTVTTETATPLGPVRIKASKTANGRITATVSVPNGMRATLLEPADGGKIVVDGKTVGGESAKSELGSESASGSGSGSVSDSGSTSEVTSVILSAGKHEIRIE